MHTGRSGGGNGEDGARCLQGCPQLRSLEPQGPPTANQMRGESGTEPKRQQKRLDVLSHATKQRNQRRRAAGKPPTAAAPVQSSRSPFRRAQTRPAHGTPRQLGRGAAGALTRGWRERHVARRLGRPRLPPSVPAAAPVTAKTWKGPSRPSAGDGQTHRGPSRRGTGFLADERCALKPREAGERARTHGREGSPPGTAAAL